MKKPLLYTLSFLSLGAMQLSAANPVMIPEFYSMKISADGKWIASDTGLGMTEVYNTSHTPDDIEGYEGFNLGNGNSFAADGTLVGSTESDVALIVKDGEMSTPASLAALAFCGLHSITPDGSRICGLVGNPEGTLPMYVPMYCDLGADGEYGEPVILPYPEKDFFGATPQYSSAVWMSSDGKVISGQVVDDSGMFIYPIVYRQGEDGKWSYTLPTASLFNPDGIVLPPNPGEFTATQPQPIDYMTAEMRVKFNNDYEEFEASGYMGTDPYEHLDEYMSAEKYAEYQGAMDDFVKKMNEYNEASSKYYSTRATILESSLPFVQNAFAMNAAGTMMAAVSEVFVDDPMSWFPKQVMTTYLFDLTSDKITKIDSKYDNLIANQVLADGTVISSTPAMSSDGLPPRTYVLAPGASEYEPLYDYVLAKYPAVGAWMKENLTKEIVVGYEQDEEGNFKFDDEGNPIPVFDQTLMSGHAVVSDDFSVLSGGLWAYTYSPDYTYESYVITDMSGTSGVKTIVNAKSNVKFIRGGVIETNEHVSDISVADLSGRTVFKAEKANGAVRTGLNNGIYVVTYTDATGHRVSKKARF